MSVRVLTAAGLLFGLMAVGLVLAQETPREGRSEEIRERGRTGDLYFRVSRLENQVERLGKELAALKADNTKTGEAGTSNEQSTTASEVKIFTLKNAEAADMMNVIQSLFTADRRDHGNIRVAGDNRTNSVIVISDPEHLRTIEAILMRLDEMPNME